MDTLELLDRIDNLDSALKQLIEAQTNNDALAILDAIDAVTEAIDALGGHVTQAINALYQSILDGAAITVELIEKVIEEAKKDVSHPQLRPVVIRIRDHEQELVAA